MQIIIHRKCQIRFSTSKIKDCNFSPLIKLRKNILNKFKETVNLSKLVKLRPHNLPFFGHNPKISQKRNHCSLFQNILLLAVMVHICLLIRILLRFSLDCQLPLFAHENRVVPLLCLHLHLFHILHIFKNSIRRLPGTKILMKRLPITKRLQLKNKFSPLKKRTNLHLLHTGFIPRRTQHRS